MKLLPITLFAFALPAAAAIEGIPVHHALTVEKCGGCHKMDENSMMGRVSYMRTTPEIWQEIIKRMMRLNGVVATPEQVRDIVRYLSANNGLAPEEAKPGFWDAEHRLIGYQVDKVPSEALQHTCNYCHTVGRVVLQRRTREDYEKLASMHVGLFPGAENVFKPRRTATSPDSTPIQLVAGPTGGNPSLAPLAPSPSTSGKYPIDEALDYLAKAQPLITPEWTAWQAAMRAPKLAGTWAVSGYQIGKGKIYGVMTVAATAAPDEFETKVDLTYANGAKIARSGKGIVYTGYSWRGRETAATKPAVKSDPGDDPAEWREAMMLSRDGNSMEGRWFWGGYDEFGVDIALTRVGKEPVVLGTDLFAIQSPSTKTLKIFGVNLPAKLAAKDVDLGPGVTIKKIAKATPTLAEIEVETAPGLMSGLRDVTVAGSTAVKAITVYDQIAYVKVAPTSGMSRLGGTISAKQYMQFETIAFTKGDIPLGPVPAAWSLEEFYSTPDDDDIKFVGAVNDSGLFTPNIEGPNPERKKQSNNYPTNNWGDVWVNATYREGDKTLKARSYLVVTIPLYVRYDQPEVAK